MFLQGIPGSTSKIADGVASSAMRIGNQNDLIVSELHGRYYEQTYRKNKFGGSIVGQVTTVGAATTYTGLCLSNPIGSGVNLILDKVGISFLVGFTASATVGVMTGINTSTNVTHTAAAVVRNKFIGAAAGFGLLDSSATLPTAPVLDIVFLAGLTGAITTSTSAADGLFELEGSIILPPGAYAAIYTSTASGAASMSASFSWEEAAI
jgi:hypothetical protein